MSTVSGIKDRDTVSVSVKSLRSGEVFEGPFTWRRRTLADLGEISGRLSQMAGGLPIVDQNIGAILRSLAELQVVVESAPDWWDRVLDEEDTSVIMAVNTKYLEWINEPFRLRREELGGRKS